MHYSRIFRVGKRQKLEMAQPPHPDEFSSYVPPPESMDNSLFDFDQLAPHSAKITLTIANENDLNRLCLKSDVSLTFPDLGVEVLIDQKYESGKK